MVRLVSLVASERCAAASRSVSAIASISPYFKAVIAETGLPLVIMARALVASIRRGRRTVPPAPGINPNVTSGRPILVPAAAMRAWQPMATSKPPPRTVPCRAATHGLVAASIASITSGRCGSSGGLPNSVTSAPAIKVLPAQAKITPMTPISASVFATASSKPWRTACDVAFTGGLSMVTVATPSSIDTATAISDLPTHQWCCDLDG